MQLYRKAAGEGSAEAHYHIGFLYETGNGVRKDNEAAIRNYNTAVSMGYAEAYTQIMLVQHQFKNFRAAANTFFRFYKANPALALAGFDNWSYSPDVLRAIQRELKSAGFYNGQIDAEIGPGTRAAIAAYVQER